VRLVPLGPSGLLVSAVGLGCNNFGGRIDGDATRRVVDAAIDCGVTLFDTADIYGGQGGSETLLGELLVGRRDQVVIATKFGHQDHDMGYGPAAGARGGRAYVRRAVHASLRRLRTDYIDLYQLHTPDPVTPVDETLAALDDLVREGSVRYVGHSNFAGWQAVDADHVAQEGGWTPFVSAQNEYSLLNRRAEREVLPAAEHLGLGFLPFFPLAKGFLTGKVTREHGAPPGSRLALSAASYVTDARVDRVETLRAWAGEHGRTLLEVAVGWLLAQPAVTSVIAGATQPEQVQANVAAAEWEPTDDELAELDAITADAG
jgi:aryl-alcohol dehydrogenase-like predicted oxidoreductase